MAIKNYLCENCDKSAVCKIMDILAKFHEEAKKDLGVNLTIDNCYNYEEDTVDSNGKDE